MYMEKTGVHGGNVKIMHVSEVYVVFNCVYFVPRPNHSTTLKVGKVVT
jgi:hypothetical protein